MAYDPLLPADHAPVVAAELRNQFQGLAAQLAALQAQLAPLVPVLNRDGTGHWTLAYAGPALDYWQVWARYAGSETWSESGELPGSGFPAADADVVPEGAPWWQIKLCGENGDNQQVTPFSNVVSFGPVPA
jgi:hypothetical protein